MTMKLHGLLTTLFVLSVMGVTGGVCQPALEIQDNSFEFGSVPQNTTVFHYFWFKSTGTDTLKINHIKTGCACVLMPLERDWIAPGDSMKVGIYWNIKRRVGKIGRYPYIFTNAREEPYRVYLKGTISITPNESRPLSIKPFKLELSKLADKSIDSLSFILHNHSDKDLYFNLLSDPFEECEFFIPEILLANSDNSCYIKVNKDYLDIEFKRSITLQLSDDRKTIITIPIRRKFY